MPTAATASIRTTSTNANLLQDIYLAKRFVETLRKSLVAMEYADMEQIPEHTGKNVRWQFFDNPTAATTPLTEGADPADSIAVLTTKVEGTIQQFGAYTEQADLFEDAAVSGTKQGFVDRAAYHARLTLDTLIHTQALNATTTTQDSGAAMTAANLQKAALKLKQNNAKGHPKSPGGNMYVFICSPEQEYDMVGEGAPAYWQLKTSYNEENISRYGTLTQDSVTGKTPQPPLRPASLHNCVIRDTTNVQQSGGDDLGALVSFNSYGMSSLGDFGIADPKVMIVPAVASLASPLAMRGTIGWKVNFVSKLFDSNRVVKVTSDVT